jgi:RNA polymerase primary sigma factor
MRNTIPYSHLVASGHISKNLAQYFSEVERYRSLSRDEEAELSKRIHQGNKEALWTLVKANLKFSISVALNYENQGLSLADLIASGNTGLIKAARRFKGEKNFKFISYAVWWIRQAILEALAEQSRAMRIPPYQAGRVFSLNRKREELEARHGRNYNYQEVAEAKGYRDLKKLQFLMNKEFYLDGPNVLDHSSEDFQGLLSSPEGDIKSEERDLREKVLKEIETLTAREKEIILSYYGFNSEVPLSLKELGERLNITRERVRQLKQRALEKLKRRSLFFAHLAMEERRYELEPEHVAETGMNSEVAVPIVV